MSKYEYALNLLTDLKMEQDSLEKDINKACHYIPSYEEEMRKARANLDMWKQTLSDSEGRMAKNALLIEALEEKLEKEG